MNVTKSRSAPVGADNQIQQRVHTLLQNVASAAGSERRTRSRRAYPYPVYLTPVNESGEAEIDETIVALGKHVSELGLDFYHTEALPYRRMIASLECGNGQWLAFEMDLSWCRFGRHGYYENGGRFLRIAESPFASCPARLEETG